MNIHPTGVAKEEIKKQEKTLTKYRLRILYTRQRLDCLRVE